VPAFTFAPSARQDLLDIFNHIALDKPIAAANWIDKIEEKCKLMATMPGWGVS
jgi:toxin ParE1/3/4